MKWNLNDDDDGGFFSLSLFIPIIDNELKDCMYLCM